MFIDEAKIEVTGGHGGPGSISFRRETFVPRGGPDGGDGGAGGSVYIHSTYRIANLRDCRYKNKYVAKAGENGSGSHKTGKSGEDTIIYVPVGTLIKDANTGEALFDFTQENQVFLAVAGGRGGKGNTHFVSSTFQAPKFAQPGEEGDSKTLYLELKLLADIGLIGLPNTGKSTLISRLTNAQPRIADFPFTTISPNLGVLHTHDYKQILIADIPGLIEGASLGQGLGTRFLKHVERTKLLVHLLDTDSVFDLYTNPFLKPSVSKAVHILLKSYHVVREELLQYNSTLCERPEILVFNKIDNTQEHQAIIKGLQTKLQKPVFGISALTGNQLSPLIEAIINGFVQNTIITPTCLPDDTNLRFYKK